MTQQRIISTWRFAIEGHSISWAGLCPWTGTPCFGTEEGTFHILPQPDASAGASTNGEGFEICPGATINCIAFSGDFAAFSSPAEIVLGTRSGPIAHSFAGGAHGVVALRVRSFLASLGADGLLRMSIQDDGSVTTRVAYLDSNPLNFYKIAPLREAEPRVFVCAARQDGIVVVNVENNESMSMERCLRFGGHDIIDVCPLNDPNRPNGVACLSRSLGVFIVPDVLSDEMPWEVRVSDMTGTGYALLVVRDKLFILSDRELLCVPNPLSTGMAAATSAQAGVPEALEISASDMFLIGDNVMLLKDGGIQSVSVCDLVGETNSNGNQDAGQFEQMSMAATQHRVTVIPSGLKITNVSMAFASAVLV